MISAHRTRPLTGLVACLASLLASCAHVPLEAPLDLLLIDGRVFTGEQGDEGALRDVGVRGDRIVLVSAPARQRPAAKRIIDASGLYVAPGFIDPHAHAEADLFSFDPAQRRVANHTLQGVTTVFIGVDGFARVDALKRLPQESGRGFGVNVGGFVGFDGIRKAVIGNTARAPTPEELSRMRSMVAADMCDGALGLSAGLYYAPQSFAGTDEVISLAHEAAVRGGVYDTHLRDEGSDNIGLLAAIEEALRIGRESGAPVNIAHIKALGVDLFGKSSAAIALIEAARASGQRVTADQYTWTASGTKVASAFIPRWAMDGGAEALKQRLADEVQLAKLRPQIADNIRRRAGPANTLITGGTHAGKRLAEVAEAWGVGPVDAVIRILLEEGDAPIVNFNMQESDIFAFARQPWVVASSDAVPGHPRKYGSFPYRWRRLVVEERILTPGQFVRRTSSLAADIYGLVDRGYLRAGQFADIVVFDPAALRERADYQRPTELSEGVRYLAVNGMLAVDHSAATDAFGGRALLKERQGSWSCPSSQPPEAH